jgi:nucleotide-binding universal stress UspA family protein
MLKTLSLVLTDESRDAPALRAAAALARREDAHLGVTALGVEPWALEAMPMASAQIVVESGRAEAQARAEALALWARAELPSDLRASIEPLTVIGLGLAAAVAQRARFSDLCVAPRPYGANRDPLGPAVPEALLFGTGAPVLFVPDRDLDWSRPFRRIALAWNDGDEALAAARAALPFLRRADRVDIAIIDPPPHAADRSDPGGDLSLWLARQGVRAEIAVLSRSQPRIGDILMRFAQDRGAEALVMGAYGHSRLREAVLGGATRDLLREVPLPLLMAR